jgi:putative restriction endonuclease
MKAGQRLWTREELILAINLYCKLPFGKLHSRNPDVIQLAGLIGRTPSAVAFKLVNFASLDPSLQARNIKGASNTGKLDAIIWNEFFQNWEDRAFESEKLLARSKSIPLEKVIDLKEEELPKEGKTRQAMVKVRVNQNFFRKAVLAAYNDTCCITGIRQRELLVAGHIRPWGLDEANRMNPRNGLAMNPLHDKAFENGLLTITPDYRIRISSELLKQKEEYVRSYFQQYEGKEIVLPTRFLPQTEFLKYHNEERFRA